VLHMGHGSWGVWETALDTPQQLGVAPARSGYVGPGRGGLVLRGSRLSSFAGLIPDNAHALGQSALPYTGQVCLWILWKTLAGDLTYCLQRIVEGSSRPTAAGSSFLVKVR
jgi:hypothetical protein